MSDIASSLATDVTFYVEARIGSSNYRNDGTEGGSPCRAVWNGGRRNEAADAVIRRLAAEVAEMKTLKFAAEQTPKQWSTARAPTVESIVATARGIQAREDAARLRERNTRLVTALQTLLTLSMPTDVSGQRMVDSARAVLADELRLASTEQPQ